MIGRVSPEISNEQFDLFLKKRKNNLRKARSLKLPNDSRDDKSDRPTSLLVNKRDAQEMLANTYPGYENIDLLEGFDLRNLISDWFLQNQNGSNSCVGFTIADGLFNFFGAKMRASRVNGDPQPTRPLNTYEAKELTIGLNRFSSIYMWFLGKELFSKSAPNGSSLDYKQGADLLETLIHSCFYGLACKKFWNEDIRHAHWGNGDLRIQDAAHEFFVQGLSDGKPVQVLTLFDNAIHSSSAFQPIEFCNWLFMNGPIAIEINLDNQILQSNRGNSPLIEVNSFPVKKKHHALTLVGWEYRDTTLFFIAKNSASNENQEFGYLTMSEAYLKEVLISAYTIFIKSNYN